MFENPKFWIAAAFFTLVVLGYRKISTLVVGLLDKRSQQIKAELDQARALREEAQQLLEEYKQKQAHYLKEAEQMLAHTRTQADAMAKQAEADAKLALDDRMRQAMQRIAHEEEKAIADVRNHIVDLAVAAARAVIIEHSAQVSEDELVKLLITDIERKLH